MYLDYSNPTLINVAISNNVSSEENIIGGGMFLRHSNPDMIHMTITSKTLIPKARPHAHPTRTMLSRMWKTTCGIRPQNLETKLWQMQMSKINGRATETFGSDTISCPANACSTRLKPKEDQI